MSRRHKFDCGPLFLQSTEFEDSIEEMLTRLDEFCGLVDIVSRAECSGSVAAMGINLSFT